MNLKRWGALLLTCVVIIGGSLWYIQKEPYSTDAVLKSAWDKFELQSYQTGEFEDPSEGDPIIHLDVYDKNEIPKVEKYLEKNLSKEDLEKYEVSVTLFKEY